MFFDKPRFTKKKNWKWVLKSWRDFLISLPFVTHPALIAIRFCQSRVIKALSFTITSKSTKLRFEDSCLWFEMDVNWANRPGSSDTWMSLNLGLLEASFQVTLFISVLVVIREEAFFNLVPSYQFAFRQQRGRREDDHSKTYWILLCKIRLRKQNGSATRLSSTSSDKITEKATGKPLKCR